MTLPELIRAMAAAGASSEAIALAIEAIDARDKDIANRKAARAEQKRIERLRKLDVARQSQDNRAIVEDVSQHVASMSHNVASTVPPEVSPQEIYNQPPILPPSGESVSARERKADERELYRQADEFYEAYPKKVNPTDGKSKFLKAVRGGADPVKIILATKIYAEACRKSGTEKQFIPAPAVWLNKGGYLSEDLPEARAGPRPAQVSLFPQAGTDPYGPDRSASAAARRNLEAVQRGEDPFAAIRARRMPPRGGDVPSEFIAGILPQK